jgi:hypothetical protein
VILDATIFHPQGGGQPADTGFIVPTGDNADGEIRFVVEDVRSKDGVVRKLFFIVIRVSQCKITDLLKFILVILLCVNLVCNRVFLGLYCKQYILRYSSFY